MNKQLKEKWIKALRSGDYKQGQGWLKNEHEEYCCLGVLLAVLDGKARVPKGKDTLSAAGRDDLLGNWDDGAKISGVAASAFDDDIRRYSASEKRTLTNPQRKLAAMNDGGKSFKQIAAYIARYL